MPRGLCSKSNLGQLLRNLLKSQREWNRWVGSMIEYKGYVGWFEFDEKANLFLGKVSNIQTSIIFQGKSIENVKRAFQKAINDYISWCKKHNKEPERPSSKVIENKFTYYGP